MIRLRSVNGVWFPHPDDEEEDPFAWLEEEEECEKDEISGHNPPELTYYNVSEVGRMLSLGRTSIYAALRDGHLERTKFGRATRISHKSITDFIRRTRSEEGQDA